MPARRIAAVLAGEAFVLGFECVSGSIADRARLAALQA